MIKKCLVCNKELYVKLSQIATGRGKFCSIKCRIEAQKGKKLSPEAKEKFVKAGYNAWKGRKHTLETRKKFSEIQRGKYGKEARGWQGGRVIQGGYIKIKTKDLFKAKDGSYKGKYKFEHRLVMEKYLGRKLIRNEMIHHRNGIKTDNRFSNLEIVIRQTHHGNVKCPHCLKEFKIK